MSVAAWREVLRERTTIVANTTVVSVATAANAEKARRSRELAGGIVIPFYI
jgi:hypothetical protein